MNRFVQSERNVFEGDHGVLERVVPPYV
jgi:hypothetical protein